MLHAPVVGGTGQSVAAVAAVQCSEQKLRLPPMKQTLLAQSLLAAQVAPNASVPASTLVMSGIDAGGSVPPHAASISGSSANSSNQRPMDPPAAIFAHAVAQRYP
jgi:hypothetical protein